jgi:hypothetical protein
MSPPTFRIEVLPDPPGLFEPGEAVPQEGWAIEAETWVYENGTRVGVHPKWHPVPEGAFSMRFEVVPA